MSYSAVYEVTRALRMLLHSQLIQAIPTAEVTLLPPGDQLPEVAGVNLYLYRVTESPSTRNDPWRGDRATGPSNNPPLGLNLFYLLTPLGTRPVDANFSVGDDSHTMLGAAMLALHENPVLNDVHIPGFDADSALSAELLRSYERVKVTLIPTNLDELSKIWATINQPYRLSVAYEASLVELTPTPPPAVPAAGVRSFNANVRESSAPQIIALAPAAGALASVDAAGALVPNTLRITGTGLVAPGQPAVVRFGGSSTTVLRTPAPTDASVSIALPTELDAGPQADVSVKAAGLSGQAVPFFVSPWLSEVQPLRTALDPDPNRVPSDLKLILRGSGFTSAPQAVRFEGPSATTTATAFDPNGTDTSATVTLPSALANGVYRVRLVRPDQAATNGRTLEVIPRVDPPVAVAVIQVNGVNVHQLTLTGVRLNGGDVRVTVDGNVYAVGANAQATTLVVTLGRTLTAGAHKVSLSVDGHNSRAVDMGV
jgi:hypothetical protein